MPKILKRLFCKHSKTIHVYSFLDDNDDGSFKTRHVWKCQNCGKEIIGA